MGNSGHVRAAAISGMLPKPGMIDGGNNAFAQNQKQRRRVRLRRHLPRKQRRAAQRRGTRVLVARIASIPTNWWR